MKRKRYSFEQIVAAMKRHGMGTDLGFDKAMLQDIAQKKVVKVALCRAAVGHLKALTNSVSGEPLG